MLGEHIRYHYSGTEYARRAYSVPFGSPAPYISNPTNMTKTVNLPSVYITNVARSMSHVCLLDLDNSHVCDRDCIIMCALWLRVRVSMYNDLITN